MHAPNSSARAILGVLPFNLLLAIAVLASGLVAAEWNWIPWAIGGAAIVATTAARRERGFQMSPSHFVERHGLVVLIALGESVVAIGGGAADLPVGFWLVAWVVLGLALAAALWWSYFDGDDERAEHAMTRASDGERTTLGIYAYYYAHLFMIAGIVIVAAGVHEAVAHLHQPFAANAWLISAGVAVYLAGAALYRRLLGLGPAFVRAGAAVVALGIVPVAELTGSLLQLVLVVAVLVAMLVGERMFAGRVAHKQFTSGA
jgi:low temperature requirement protein LtrA